VRAPDRLRGLRVVGAPDAIDRATWVGEDVTVLRFAPDDAFGLGARGVEIDDEHAIVEAEVGFVGTWLAPAEIERHTEWQLPTERPAFAQGSIAGVPSKVWLPDDGEALLITAAAYAEEMAGRLRASR